MSTPSRIQQYASLTLTTSLLIYCAATYVKTALPIHNKYAVVGSLVAIIISWIINLVYYVRDKYSDITSTKSTEEKAFITSQVVASGTIYIILWYLATKQLKAPQPIAFVPAQLQQLAVLIGVALYVFSIAILGLMPSSLFVVLLIAAFRAVQYYMFEHKTVAGTATEFMSSYGVAVKSPYVIVGLWLLLIYSVL